MGGVLVYDVTDPRAPVRVDYLNTREDWTTDDPGTVLATAGDLGPEGLAFIPASASPTGEPLLMGRQRSERHDRHLPGRAELPSAGRQAAFRPRAAA